MTRRSSVEEAIAIVRRASQAAALANPARKTPMGPATQKKIEAQSGQWAFREVRGADIGALHIQVPPAETQEPVRECFERWAVAAAVAQDPHEREQHERFLALLRDGGTFEPPPVYGLDEDVIDGAHRVLAAFAYQRENPAYGLVILSPTIDGMA